jgi:hypothetical protein
MKTAQELYPNCYFKYNEDDEELVFSAPTSYLPIIENLGNVLIEVSDCDWTGVSRFLLEKEGKFAVFIYHWGSCSGCDSLQCCENYEDIQSLMEDFNSRLMWHSKEEIFFKIETGLEDLPLPEWQNEEDLEFNKELKSWMEKEKG